MGTPKGRSTIAPHFIMMPGFCLIRSLPHLAAASVFVNPFDSFVQNTAQLSGKYSRLALDYISVKQPLR
ncbi:MAG: hypothetical protein ACXWT1_05365 [Methylobacter sp.]